MCRQIKKIVPLETKIMDSFIDLMIDYYFIELFDFESIKLFFPVPGSHITLH